MRRRGAAALLLGGLLFAAFVVLSLRYAGQDAMCAPPGEDCLVRSVQALDAPETWPLAMAAGVAAAAGFILLRRAASEPPSRAFGVSWEEFMAERGARRDR